ncbi:MAG: tetratricopeptide repeat-containing sulfotransferase family protein [Lysobacterales bacterium]|jgi:tetratricopeptide (TPR) repeat protein
MSVETRQRLRGLAPAHAVSLREVMRLHAAGDRRGFEIELLQLAPLAAEHPEVQYWLGQMHADSGDWSAAAEALSRSAAARADDFRVWRLLGTARGMLGDPEGARQSFQRAVSCTRVASDLLSLSIECDRQGLYEEALAAVDQALRLDRQSPVALLQRVRCHKALGNAGEAAADCRSLIATGRETARAWFSLVDLKTVALTESERQTLAAAASRPGWSADDRQLLDFALGNALEAAGEYVQALAAFQRANAAVRAQAPWNASAFLRHTQQIRSAFIDPPASRAESQGGEVIFLVGLPRSGSTLVEQVLAAHPQVEGASELPYLGQVLEAESRRRGRPFPAWVGEASTQDWTRLGQQYLRLSARWRTQTPIATDKLPDNWLYVGAIRAMLPDARVIDCRREALETCWSCFKQRFGPGLAGFSYDFDSLATYLHACEALGDAWAQLHPAHVRVQRYEALVADPEPQIRALLEFCGLPFDAACLDFQSARRAIRTPSALQVRQPLSQTSAPAARYGALLDPLRRALSSVR